MPNSRFARGPFRLALVLPIIATTLAIAPTDASAAINWTTAFRDDFSRTLNSGWGSSPVGGQWTTNGGTNSSVDGAAGVVSLPANGSFTATTSSVSYVDGGIRAEVSVPPVGERVRVETRVQASGASYSLELSQTQSGLFDLRFWRPTPTGKQYAGSIQKRLTVTPGQRIVLELRTDGTRPVRLYGRAWIAGTTPSSTLLYYEDKSVTRLTLAGQYRVSAVKNSTPGATSFDNVEVFVNSAEVPTPTSTPTSTPVTATPPRYLLWNSLSTTPTDDQIRSAAGKYSVVLFNSFMAPQASLLRSLDSQVKILTYVDLSSTRSYDGSRAIVTGVNYTDATNKGWLALDTNGQPVTWGAYPGHYQTTVWDTAYQDAWVNHALEIAASGPFDGVFADNDTITLSYYTTRLLAGTSSQSETDAKLRAGLDALIAKAGPALKARGKLLVPNIGDSRQRPSTWNAHSAYGGGFEEMFMSWSTDSTPDVWDWGTQGWRALTGNISNAPVSLATTQSASGDRRTQVYGYASFLLSARPGDGWAANANSASEYPPEALIDPGTPVTTASQVNGAYVRTFSKAWVAVNPSSTATVTVTPPTTATLVSGGAATSITLQPMSAAIVRL